MGIALVLRIVFVFVLPTDHYTYDGKMYQIIADGIKDGNPIAAFPNGYPLLIAMVKILTGLNYEMPLLLLNFALSLWTVWLTYRIALRIAPENENVALISALCIAIFPHSLRYAQLLMTETLTTTLLALAALLTLAALERLPFGEPKKPVDAGMGLLAAFAAGAISGIASAVRPSVGLVTPLLFGLGFLLRQRRVLLWLLLGGYLATTLFFLLLDRAHVTKPPHTLGNNALIAITSFSHQVKFIEFSEEEQRHAPMEYAKFALKQPLRFLAQRAVSAWELWGFYSLPGNKPENRTLPVRFVVFCRFWLLLLSLHTLFWRRREWAIWVLFMPVLVVTLIHVMTFSNHRFVAPLEPLLFVLSIMAVFDLLARGRHRFGARANTQLS